MSQVWTRLYQNRKNPVGHIDTLNIFIYKLYRLTIELTLLQVANHKLSYFYVILFY